MNRRDYLRQIGVACGAVGLAGCSVLGGSETATPTPDVATGTVELDRSTPTPSAVETTEQLQAAVDAAEAARSTYGDGVAAVTSLDASGDYQFRGRTLESDVSALRTALEDVKSERARSTLGALADYFASAASALQTVEPAVENLVGIVGNLARALILPTGGQLGRELTEVRDTLQSARQSLQATTPENLDPVENVLSSAVLTAIETNHERLTSQLRGLGRLADTLRTYLDAAERYVQGGQHRQEAEQAGGNDPEKADRQLQQAIEDYEAAESLFRDAEGTLASLELGVGDEVAGHLDRLECRMGAFADASDHWQEFAQLIIDRAAPPEIEDAEAAAREALQRCREN